jgi:predicted enzyme involved in methoxymalonyl-ACP biosynthesis
LDATRQVKPGGAAKVLSAHRTMEDVSLAEMALARAQWQPALFADRPRRLELLALRPDWALEPVAVRIHRNHSFEHVASVAGPWFAWWGCRPGFTYSDYDDSFAFGSVAGETAQLEIVWADVARYAGRLEGDALADWICGRLASLRSMSAAPILLVALGTTAELHGELTRRARGIPGTRVADLEPLASSLGDRFTDARAAKFSGTRLSDHACVLVARELACRWVPAMLRPRVKAVAVDLDNTLYSGVLGEDGEQVVLTPAHKALQESLANLRSEGVFLALVSRNEEDDVRKLFALRPDFPLR